MSAILFSLCMVIGVSDGDSMTLKCPERVHAVTVRLAEIDAPELAHPSLHIAIQPFGPEAHTSLSTLCLGKGASVRRIAIDKYGRSVAQVQCNGVDASLYQVQHGMAWAYTTHLLPHSQMPAAQAQAQAAGLGLWSQPNPIAPWIWRKQK